MRHLYRIALGVVGLVAGLSCSMDGPSAPMPSRGAAVMSRTDDDHPGGDDHEGGGTPGSVLAKCTPRRVQSGSAVIGPSGGILQVGDDYLVVPGGALLKAVEISGEIPAEPFAAIRLQPEGLQFRKPARLIFSADGCELRDEVARVVYLDDQGTVLEEIDAEYFPRFKTVAAPISHFSIYAVATMR